MWPRGTRAIRRASQHRHIRTAPRHVGTDADDGSAVTDDRSDAELLTASAEEPEAFTELYRRHAEDLLRYFARRTLDPETAAELTAETFAEAFASRASYRDQ